MIFKFFIYLTDPQGRRASHYNLAVFPCFQFIFKKFLQQVDPVPLQLHGVLPDDAAAPRRVLQLLQQLPRVAAHVEDHRHLLALVAVLQPDGQRPFLGLGNVERQLRFTG